MRDWLKNVFNNIEDCDHIRHEVRRAANHGLALSLSRDNVVRLAAMEDIAENGEIDFGDRSHKHRLHYHAKTKKWLVNQTEFLRNPITIYFKTKASAEKCLADIGNELDILIGEV